MVNFNKFFNKDDERYVDIPLNTDIELYIDPTSIRQVNSPYFNSELAGQKVSSFFQHVFDLYLKDKKEESLILITEPSEINSTHLGMSSGASKGNGPSERILNRTFKKLVELAQKDTDLLKNPILIPLFVPRFGKDRFSDLLTCIIIKELCEFTTNICKELRIELSSKSFRYYDIDKQAWVEKEFLLPIGPDGEHIVLLPKSIVKENYTFNAQSFVWKTIFQERQNFHLVNNTDLTRTKEVDGEMILVPPSKTTLYEKEVSGKYEIDKIKQYALKQTLEKPHLLEHYIRFVEEQINQG